MASSSSSLVCNSRRCLSGSWSLLTSGPGNTFKRQVASVRSNAAVELRDVLKQNRAKMVADLLPCGNLQKTQQVAQGARLRWGRGPLGSAARAAAAELEAAEAEAERRIQQSIGRSPIGLYPVYDCPRQVAGAFTGTKVLQPSSLRYALAEAATRVPRAASDGRSLLAGAGKDEEEEIELIEVEEEP
eukprot:TRINITY_DN107249_c0_g1_i1.p1 TRINITY_DN107249_c0_g1~~TRINITY_DN107249_c0_g1_i1.p1  ORF type:complete len:195 (+),score=41.83 TRINITY_DN107249_c0_g1_i1:26-586(+)